MSFEYTPKQLELFSIANQLDIFNRPKPDSNFFPITNESIVEELQSQDVIGKKKFRGDYYILKDRTKTHSPDRFKSNEELNTSRLYNYNLKKQSSFLTPVLIYF